MTPSALPLPAEPLAEFCLRNHICKLSLFGSGLRNSLEDIHDIDLLVEFEPDHIPGLIRLSGMEVELSKMLGKKVDLRTPHELSPYFRNQVLDEARIIYGNLG